eukprot:jgi/Ulvmu1/9584/UM054_0014.1
MFDDADSRWQPTEIRNSGTAISLLALRAFESEAAVNPFDAESAPQRTIMQCLGTEALTRACHFENVYYAISSKRFAYFGPDGSASELFGKDDQPGEPWLRLIRGLNGAWKGSELEKQFHMDWRGGEPLPPARQVVTYRQPLHLRGTMITRSIGHLLRDNLMGLVDLPMRFGRDPVDFDWVRWESEAERSPWRDEHTTAKHYRGLLNNRPSVTWQEVLDQALPGARRGVKYIQFSEIIAGMGPVDITSHVGKMKVKPDSRTLSAWAHMCAPFPFAAMRDVAYRLHGLQVSSAPDLEPFVLFLDGKPREKRHLTNAGAIIPTLKKKFPGVRMEHVQISEYSLQKQLELLSQATVVISNIGSRSFRLIYLPNGATTILVGPPEFQYQLPPKKKGGPVTKEKVPMPFQEIDSCWGYIGYVNMLQYHVTREEEVHRFKRWTSWMDARDTDIMLDEEKVAALLRTALHRTRNSVSYHGAGTLAAV